jgi:hypothetical protein
MGYALYISLQSPIDGFDHVSALDGKSIGANEEFFSSKVKGTKTNPLNGFISVSMEDMADFFDDADDMPEVKEEWFEPSQGLETISEYLKIVDLYGRDLKDPELIADDLNAMKSILQKAEQHSVKWHLSCDI